MRTLIEAIRVPGHPRPKGSLDVVNASRKVLADNDLSVRWRGLMAYKLGAAYGGQEPARGPIGVWVVFHMPCTAEALLTRTVGDVDKLVRNLLDALADDPKKPKLSARVFADDSQVVLINATKVVADNSGPGAFVSVYEMELW